MACHVHRMERVESGDTLWPSKKPGPHQVGLVEFSNVLRFERGIGFLTPIGFLWLFIGFAVSPKDPGNRRQGRNMAHMPLLEFPADDLRSNPRKGRTFCLVRFQLLPNGQNGLNHGLRSPSPNPLWGSTPILETFQPMLLIAAQPFGEPESPPSKEDKDSLKCNPFFVVLYRVAAFLILGILIHRSKPFPNKFGKNLKRLSIQFAIL